MLSTSAQHVKNSVKVLHVSFRFAHDEASATNPATKEKLPVTFIGNPLTKAAVCTPPVGEARIREKLSDWERFVHPRDGIF